RTHLRTYLESRLAIFAELIDSNDDGLWAPIWTSHYENDQQPPVMMHAANRSGLQAVLDHVCGVLAFETPLFEPVMYLWLGIVLLALFCRDRMTIAVAASGLVYEL